MAKKDSFLLYTDQKAVIDKLSNEQAGILIKAIYNYVETGTLNTLDTTLDLVITPFITTIDRDKRKYEQISEIRAKASKSRQNKQKIANDNKCNDSDNDSDTDNESDNDSDNSSSDVIVSDSCDDGLRKIIKFYEDNIGPVTPYSLEILSSYLSEMNADVVIYAMQKAVDSKIRTLAYIKSILNSWSKKGIKTLIEAQEESRKFKEKDKKDETEEEAKKRKLKELEEAETDDKCRVC